MAGSVGSRLRLRQDWIWAAIAAGGLLLFSYRALSRSFAGADYVSEARPAFDALVAGHIGDFLHGAPVYAGSLVLRAPFVLGAHAFGAGELWMYRASVIPGLLGSGALAVWLASRMGQGGAHWLGRLVVAGLCVANPIAIQAVYYGHPEDLLGAVLCVAAVLCAIGDRPIWAGVLLGLAIPNKEWALLAVGAVLVALPRRRVLSVLWAVAVAAAIFIPFVIAGNPNLGLARLPGVNTANIFHPWQVWWFFGSAQQGYRSPPGWVSTVAHPLIVAISIPLTLLYVDRTRRRPGAAADPTDPLLLLALLLLLRCMLDPWDIPFYPTPFLFALVTWEALRFRRLPVISVGATVVTWLLYTRLPNASVHLPDDRTALLFLIVSVCAAAAIGCDLYAPGLRDRLIRRARPRASIRV
jgi:hypothetical protein